MRTRLSALGPLALSVFVNWMPLPPLRDFFTFSTTLQHTIKDVPTSCRCETKN